MKEEEYLPKKQKVMKEENVDYIYGLKNINLIRLFNFDYPIMIKQAIFKYW
jgi:hypothetical protein